MATPSLNSLRHLLQRADISLAPAGLEKLWRYHNLIRNRNQDRELTRIIQFEAMVLKHYIDSMIIGKFVRLPSPLLDIGTGAGFPGIPLKILYPNLKVILAEPRPKRIEFLNEAISNLKLTGASVFEHKVVSASFQTPVQGVITRALETMDKTCLRTSACLGKGGKLIFLKGPSVDSELKDLQKRFSGQFRIETDKYYRLPYSPHERRLIVLEKQVDRVLPRDIH